MEKREEGLIIYQIRKLLEAVQPGPNDITNFIVRFEGKTLKQVDLDRHLSRPV